MIYQTNWSYLTSRFMKEERGRVMVDAGSFKSQWYFFFLIFNYTHSEPLSIFCINAVNAGCCRHASLWVAEDIYPTRIMSILKITRTPRSTPFYMFWFMSSVLLAYACPLLILVWSWGIIIVVLMWSIIIVFFTRTNSTGMVLCTITSMTPHLKTGFSLL